MSPTGRAAAVSASSTSKHLPIEPTKSGCCARTGAGTGGKHHPVGAHLLGGPVSVDHLDGTVADEGRLTVVDREVILALAVVLTSGGDGIDATKRAIPDLPPTHPVQGQVHPKCSCLLGEADHRCRVDEHLRWDTAPVQTGAAEGPAFDHGHRQVLKALIEERVART